jgi:hypothetical protein
MVTPPPTSMAEITGMAGARSGGGRSSRSSAMATISPPKRTGVSLMLSSQSFRATRASLSCMKYPA